MNQQIINYFKENKDKYSKEVLTKELEKVGYNVKDINEGVDIVFGGAVATVSNFWDFKSKKVYVKKSEKVKDFLFGFFVCLSFYIISFAIELVSVFIFSFYSSNVFRFIGFGGFIVYIFALFYFFNRRRYISYGLILAIIFSIMAPAILAFMFFL